jgi:hypothetical protein
MTAVRMSRPALVLVLFVVGWLVLLAGSAAADNMPPPSDDPAPPAQNGCPAGGCVNTYDGDVPTPKTDTHGKQDCDAGECGQDDPPAPRGCDSGECGRHDDPGSPQVLIVPGNPPAQRPGPGIQRSGPRAQRPAPPAAAGDPAPRAVAPQGPGVDFVPGNANPVPVLEQSATSRGAGAAAPAVTTLAGSDTAETPTTQFRVRLRSGVTVKILAVYFTRMSVDVQNYAGREYGKIRTMTYWGAGATIGAGFSVTRLSDWEDYNTAQPVTTSDFGGGAYRGELAGATVGTWCPGGSVGSNLGPPNNASVVMPNASVGLGVSLGAYGYGQYR